MRLPSLAISLGAHGIVLCLLLFMQPIQLPQREKSEYKLAIEGKEEKLVWYKFDKLPDVRPMRESTESKPLRAEAPAKQEIVASPKQAPKRKQIVLMPAPELPDLEPIESPNLLAMRVKLPPEAFVTPPDIQRPPAPHVELPPEAPAIDVSKMVKRFIPPPTQVPAKLAEVAPPPEAPQLQAANVPQVPDFKTKLAPRPFTSPTATPSAAFGRPKEIAVGAPPELAVVGLTPTNIPAPLPTASSPAQFSAGPVIRRNGPESAGEGKGLAVPDLFVRGAPDAKPNLLAEVYAAPTSAANMREAMRLTGRSAIPREEPLPSQSRAGAVKVSGAPDPRFNGRDVYMMAIQMPNLTSYSGSWLMWYSDRTARETGLAPIAAPGGASQSGPEVCGDGGRGAH